MGMATYGCSGQHECIPSCAGRVTCGCGDTPTLGHKSGATIQAWDTLLLHASHHHGQVQEWLHEVWQWHAPPPPKHRHLLVCTYHHRGCIRQLHALWQWLAPTLRPGMNACWCMLPTIMGEYRNGSARCGGDRHPPLSRHRCLLVHTSHHWGKSNNGSMWCGNDSYPSI